MQTRVIIIFIMVISVFHVSYADDRKGDIKEMVKKAVEQLTEYEIPENILNVMQGYQGSFNAWKDRIDNHRKAIALINEKILVCEANQSHDASSIKHTLRTYLAGMGVPYNDLQNWKIENFKAVRIQPQILEKQ